MNTRNGSTSAELEDPNETANPEQQESQGAKPEGDQQEQETQQTEEAAPAGKDTPPLKPETEPADKDASEAAPAEDPVKAAIERLASDGKPSTATPPAKAQPAQAGDAKPTSGDDAVPKPEGDGKAGAQPRADDANPLSGWTEQELKHTKGAVKDRFRALHAQEREARAKLDELAPAAEIGMGWSGMLREKKLEAEVQTLDDDQIAWSIRAQGAAVRAVQAVEAGLVPNKADLATLEQLRAGIAEVDKAIGRVSPPTDPNALAEAFTGQIPEDLKEAAELAGLSEKEARLIAALRSHKPAPVAKPATAPAPGAPTAPQQQQPHPQQRAPEAPARDAQAVENDRFWARKTNSAIEATGVKKEAVADFFASTVAPILGRTLARYYPGQPPTVAFGKLGPAERHQLVVEAIAEHQAASAPPTPPPRTTHRAPLRAGGGGSGSPGKPGDAVSLAIAHLAIPGT